MHIQKQKQDAFETMIVNIENYLQEKMSDEILSQPQRLNWENEAGMLLSEYQDDLKELQDKYIQQLCVLYRKNLPRIQLIDNLFLQYEEKLACYLNIIKEQAPEDEETREIIEENSDECDLTEELKQSAIKVIEDIDGGKIFDDIKIDFDNILANLAPEADPAKLNQMLINYYEEIHDVLQKRLDECQDIIEEYMTHLIESKKRDLQTQMEKYAMGEDDAISPALISDATKNDISSITVDHNNKLKMLREQYDEFLGSAESEFFNVLRMIKTDPKSIKKLQNKLSHTQSSKVKNELERVANDFIQKQQKESVQIQAASMKQDQKTVFDNALKMHNSSSFNMQKSNGTKSKLKLTQNPKSGVFNFDNFKENREEISERDSFVDYNQVIESSDFDKISSTKEFANVEQSIKEMYQTEPDEQNTFDNQSQCYSNENNSGLL